MEENEKMSEKEFIEYSEKLQKKFDELVQIGLILTPMFNVNPIIGNEEIPHTIEKNIKFNWVVIEQMTNGQKDGYLLQMFCLSIVKDILEKRFNVDQYHTKSTELQEELQEFQDIIRKVGELLTGIEGELLDILINFDYNKPKKFNPR